MGDNLGTPWIAAQPGRSTFVGQRRKAKSPAYALQGPKLALIFAFYRNRERTTGADPPFSRVQRALAFQWLAMPATELPLPHTSTEEAIGDHGALVARDGDVFLGAGGKWSFPANDPVAFQHRPNVL